MCSQQVHREDAFASKQRAVHQSCFEERRVAIQQNRYMKQDLIRREYLQRERLVCGREKGNQGEE